MREESEKMQHEPEDNEKKKKGGKKKSGKNDAIEGQIIPDYACEDVALDNPFQVELRSRIITDFPDVNPFSISHIGLDFTGTLPPVIVALFLGFVCVAQFAQKANLLHLHIEHTG